MSKANDLQQGASEGTVPLALAKVRSKLVELRRQARANYRVMEGMQRLSSREDWQRMNEESLAAYESGEFFLKRAGAERYVEPQLMATLLSLRHGLLGDARIATAEKMLVDMAVMSYQHFLRVHGWIGDLMLRVDHEFFGDAAFTEVVRHAKLKHHFSVEDRLRRLSEQLLPVLDRADRMVIRNLQALKELRQGQAPAIAVRMQQQVTVTNRHHKRVRPPKTRLQRLWDHDVTVAERRPLRAGSDRQPAALSAALADGVAPSVVGAEDRRERVPARSSKPLRWSGAAGGRSCPSPR